MNLCQISNAQPFGALASGEKVHEILLRAPGIEAKVLTYGAILRDLRIEGRSVVLGLNSVEDYERHSPLFGAIVGRFANRVRHGKITLNGTDFQLSRNSDGRHHLHGGEKGFARRVWTIVEASRDAVLLELVSPDGEEGYPGRAVARCRYRLDGKGGLSCELVGTTDRPTVMNLVHHSYFNLDGGEDIYSHRLRIAADCYLPIDEDAIPNGEIASVIGTAYDFRAERPVRAVGDTDTIAYDNNYCLGGLPTTKTRFAACLKSVKSGLKMELWTTEPGVQFYGGDMINVPVEGLDGRRYGPCAGLCLEPQRWPDSPNQAFFTDSTLYPGQVYRQLSEFRFS